MKNLDLIGEELFNKIRGRFPSVTIGNGECNVTNVPNEARFFDFDFKEGDLIEVEKLGWPIETGVVTGFRGDGPRKYWEWVGTSGKTMFFFEVKTPLQEDFKIKVLAAA